MITLSKIAKLAHVSVSTASKAFSMSQDVSEETREAVFDVARQYGCFKKYYKAKYPKHVIAVICPELQSRFYSEALSAIQECLAEYNCEICINSYCYSEETLRNIVEYYGLYTAVDGIIFIGTTITEELDVDIPYAVVFGKGNIDKCTVCVHGNYYDLIFKIVHYYVSKGIENVGFISESRAMKKYDYFVESYRKLTDGKEPAVVVSEKRFEEGGYEAMESFFERGCVPRVVVCAYDYMAIGAVKCINDRGLKVPDDVAVVGMDDLPEAKYLNPPLASVETGMRKGCFVAATELMNYLLGNEYQKNVVVKCGFNMRESGMINN